MDLAGIAPLKVDRQQLHCYGEKRNGYSDYPDIRLVKRYPDVLTVENGYYKHLRMRITSREHAMQNCPLGLPVLSFSLSSHGCTSTKEENKHRVGVL